MDMYEMREKLQHQMAELAAAIGVLEVALEPFRKDIHPFVRDQEDDAAGFDLLKHAVPFVELRSFEAARIVAAATKVLLCQYLLQDEAKRITDSKRSKSHDTDE